MAVIYCFTSTGNSLYVSKKIAEKIGASVFPMTKDCESCFDHVIGFVFPSYFWGLPKIVENFILHMEIENKNAYIFCIVTYGSKAPGVDGKVKNLLKQKGVTLSYSDSIKSVENYLPMYNINDSDELHADVDRHIEKIAVEIAREEHNKTKGYTILNRLIYKAFPLESGHCDKYFSVSKKCNHCGTCQKICPVNNIDIKDSNILFNHRCEHCLACIHACPLSAIDWKDKTKDKRKYRNPHISLNELQSFIGKI